MTTYYGPDPETVKTLRRSLLLLRDRLIRAGELHVAQRLSDDEARLGRGDMSAIRSIISEATGSMGSLNDVTILSEQIGELRTLAEFARNSAWKTHTQLTT